MGLSQSDPHANTRTLAYGVPLEQAKAAMILVHGRGASPEDILGIGAEVDPGDVIYLAPAAMTSAWYPYPFLVPRDNNQPWLDSALKRVGALVDHVVGAGIPVERIMLLGFSQGACLASEFAARNPQRYGGVFALSGGLIGADEELEGYSGSLDGTPVFFGCSNVDPHIPEQRVRRSAEVIRGLGGVVDERIYPNMGHVVNQDEIDAVKAVVKVVVGTA